MKSGKLVVYVMSARRLCTGKGGEVYVLGNAAGRPHQCRRKTEGCHKRHGTRLPRRILHGGRSVQGGGFVILNGLSFDNEGKMVPLEIPYPGSNIFSLASGGAIFVRDPHKTIVPEQLNGGQFFHSGSATGN